MLDLCDILVGDPRRVSSDGRSPSNRRDKFLGRYGLGIPEGVQAMGEALATDGNRWEKCLGIFKTSDAPNF